MQTPAKIQRLIDHATRSGLLVTFHEDTEKIGNTEIHSWTLTSADPYDRDALWIFWTPGPRGGRVSLRAYRPHAKRLRGITRAQKITRGEFHTWAQVLGGVA